MLVHESKYEIDNFRFFSKDIIVILKKYKERKSKLIKIQDEQRKSISGLKMKISIKQLNCENVIKKTKCEKV